MGQGAAAGLRESNLPETRANDPRDRGSSDEITPRTDKDSRRGSGPDDLLAAIPGDNESRIFLSHRSAGKALVRPFFELLRELGHQPWLDAHDMPAGTTLHRGITEGVDVSCAVVFFVTRNFEDERWLAREVDQAVHRKIEVGDKFAIITLTSEADAIREIVRALPLELGPPRWKQRVYKKKVQ